MDTSDAGVVFSEGGYAVDRDKNLYVMRAGGRVLVQKLKKHIYKLLVYREKAYFIDTFGDCFLIGDGLVFMFGILGMPSFLGIRNDRVFVLDAYRRMWIHDLSGRLVDIVFVKTEPDEIVLEDRFMVVFARPEEGGSLRAIKVFNSEHRLVLSCAVREVTEYRPTCLTFTSEDGTFRFDVVSNKMESL